MTGLAGLLLLFTALAGYGLLRPVHRTILQVWGETTVDLPRLEESIRTLDGSLGLAADLRTGLVTVDHRPALGRQQLASTLTSQGFSVAILSTRRILPFNTLTFSQVENRGAEECCLPSQCPTGEEWRRLWARWRSRDFEKQQCSIGHHQP